METPVALQRTVRDDFSLPPHPESTQETKGANTKMKCCGFHWKLPYPNKASIHAFFLAWRSFLEEKTCQRNNSPGSAGLNQTFLQQWGRFRGAWVHSWDAQPTSTQHLLQGSWGREASPPQPPCHTPLPIGGEGEPDSGSRLHKPQLHRFYP